MVDILYIFWFTIINMDFILILNIFLGLLLYRKTKVIGMWMAFISLLMLTLIQCTSFCTLPGKYLENMADKPSYKIEEVEGFILLGGSYAQGATIEQPLFNLAGSRLIDFIVLIQKHPDKKVIFTGSPMEAEITKEYFKKFNVAHDRIIIEGKSCNTEDNAKNTATLIDKSKKWVLVTSAFHMCRSVKLFHKYGIHVVSHPVDYHVSSKWQFEVMKGGSMYWGATMKEFAGLMHLSFFN